MYSCCTYKVKKTIFWILRTCLKKDKTLEADKKVKFYLTFQHDRDRSLNLIWYKTFKNDDAFLAHLDNTAVGEYLREN